MQKGDLLTHRACACFYLEHLTINPVILLTNGQTSFNYISGYIKLYYPFWNILNLGFLIADFF